MILEYLIRNLANIREILVKIIDKMNTDCIILGCTELPLILEKSNYIIDPMNIKNSIITVKNLYYWTI